MADLEEEGAAPTAAEDNQEDNQEEEEEEVYVPVLEQNLRLRRENFTNLVGTVILQKAT